MMSDHYFCKNKGRRRAIRGQENPRFNGIDYLEVMPDQKTLKIHFIFSVQSELKKDNVIIEGGERIKDIRVNNAAISDDRKVLTVELNNYGDFSTYTLYIVESGSENLPGNLDPQLSMIDFSFKVQCLGDLDCKREIQCPPEKYEEPDINYLAKDYTGFKNLMMDRLSVIWLDCMARGRTTSRSAWRSGSRVGPNTTTFASSSAINMVDAASISPSTSRWSSRRLLIS